MRRSLLVLALVSPLLVFTGGGCGSRDDNPKIREGSTAPTLPKIMPGGAGKKAGPANKAQ
jgi:hypothetical protein